MKASVEKIEKNQVKLTIEVDAQDFEKSVEKAYHKNKRKIAVPGFRKGKAPRKIIEHYYGEGVFYEDALNEACPDAYIKAVEETGIEPVDQPEIEIVQVGSGKNLIFHATVTVKPEVELGQYKGIEIEKVEYNVTDQDVDQRIEQVREQNARWISVEDGPAKEGHRLTIDFKGYINGEAFEGGSAEKFDLELGSGQFIPGFEEQLVGVKAGEEKEIKVTFPEDYAVENLKGKEATFVVKVHDIKEKELPALDDEFAKDVSEFDTLDEYRADIKNSMEKNAQEAAKAEMETKLIEKISQNAKVDIPDVMVERQLDNMMQDFDFRLRFQGMDLERYVSIMGISMDEFRAQYKDEAYNRVKNQLVLEKIIKVEKIEATDEDLEKEYKRLAEQYNQDVDQVKKSYEGREDGLKDSIVIQKTIDFLMDNAVLVEKSDDEASEQSKEAEESKETEE